MPSLRLLNPQRLEVVEREGVIRRVENGNGKRETPLHPRIVKRGWESERMGGREVAAYCTDSCASVDSVGSSASSANPTSRSLNPIIW